MKANELKVTDLKVGDWVICYHPSRLKSLEKVSVGLLHTMQEQEYGHVKEDSPLFRIVEPIPLTPEILEKNGFYRSEIPTRGEIGHYYHRKIAPSSIFVSMSFEDGRDFGNEIKYVHQLQHTLRLCGIDKEIEL